MLTSRYFQFRNSTPLSNVTDLNFILNRAPYFFSRASNASLMHSCVACSSFIIISSRVFLSVNVNKLVLAPCGPFILSPSQCPYSRRLFISLGLSSILRQSLFLVFTLDTVLYPRFFFSFFTHKFL